MTNEEIQEIIGACRLLAQKKGILIPDISIDRSELAQAVSSSGIATLSNEQSIKHANIFAKNRKEEAPNWELGRVMCISDQIIKAKANDVFAIGVIMHEMGHAFNIAAKLKNTEANAQVFELNALLAYGKEKISGDHAYTDEDLDKYLQNRMKTGYFCGSNLPSVDGYIELHRLLRGLPKQFIKGRSSYLDEFASLTKSQRQNPNFSLTVQIIDTQKANTVDMRTGFLGLKRLKRSPSEEIVLLDSVIDVHSGLKT